MKRSVPALLSVLFLASSAVATDPAPQPQDVTKVTCKEVMASNDQGRAVSIAFYQGYLLGKQDASSIDVLAASDKADAVLDFCLSNPTSTVLDAFAKASR